MTEFYAYHVVTERPMHVGQQILFDGEHHNGVYRRVRDKLEAVRQIVAHPEQYDPESLEHHTSVALRELALEQVRREKYPQYPSRMACLYVSDSLEDARMWSRLFAEWGRPTYQIVRLKIRGRCFAGDANNCFPGQVHEAENLRLAEHYWENCPNPAGERPIVEMLADGELEVIEIIERIDQNI